MTEEIECNIKGRVQLVMYRDFAQRKAKEKNINGFVKNLKNGMVQVVAQGEKENLEEYIKLLNKGPILAKVDSVDVSWRKPTKALDGFRIIY